MVWIYIPAPIPLNANVGTLMVLGGGAYGKRLCFEGGDIKNAIFSLMEESNIELPYPFQPCEDIARGRWPSSEYGCAGTLILDISAFREIDFCCL